MSRSSSTPRTRPSSALRAARIPVAMHVDGLEWKRAKWGVRASRYYRWAGARSARWADAVIADAHGIADHIREAHGVHAHYIPYGAPIVSPDSTRLAEVGVAARQYHLVVARFEPENHVRQIRGGLRGIRGPDAADRDRRRTPMTTGHRSRLRPATTLVFGSWAVCGTPTSSIPCTPTP